MAAKITEELFNDEDKKQETKNRKLEKNKKKKMRKK